MHVRLDKFTDCETTSLTVLKLSGAVHHVSVCLQSFKNLRIYWSIGDCGGTVVKVLCYKSEGRWFDSSWCHSNFSLT